VEAQLRAGAALLGLELTEPQLQQVLRYADLLQKWGRVYNLTAVRRPGEMVTHHLLDCLAAIPPLRRMCVPMPPRVLDVGSGAGLPGAVIAITCPESTVDCVDAVGKKAAFVQQVAASLALANLRGLHSRVEQLEGGYDLAACRAFASLGHFVAGSGVALAPDGLWLAMKGKYPVSEIAELPAGVEMFHVEQLHVPGLDAERCLVWMRRRSA
jgi:16S rRNA (guanine527-N7)-methyltransferase